MGPINEQRKKDVGYLLGAAVAAVTIYVSLHGFIYPRTEANAAMEAISKRVDDLGQKQKEKDDQLNSDISDIKRDISGIYKILINQKH